MSNIEALLIVDWRIMADVRASNSITTFDVVKCHDPPGFPHALQTIYIEVIGSTYQYSIMH